MNGRKLQFIYALFNSKSELFYVGITEDCEVRIKTHKKRFGEFITMVVLFETRDREYGLRKERHIIAEFQKIGICLLNKKCGKKPTYPVNI